MNSLLFLMLFLAILSATYYFGRRYALSSVNHPRELHSLPSYHGFYVAAWFALPAVLAFGLWSAIEPIILDSLLLEAINSAPLLSGTTPDLLLNEIHSLAFNLFALKSATPEKLFLVARFLELKSIGANCQIAVVFGLGATGVLFAKRKLSPTLRARQTVENIFTWLLILCSVIAVLTTIGIVLSLLFESIRFFNKVTPTEFLFGLHWSPQTALRSDQIGASGAFGAVPIFAGTLLITVIAMAVSIPIGLLSAVYMAEYASPNFRNWVKPVLEILAGVPTVVYGFFAALTVAPLIRGFGESIGLNVASESALAAGLVMGVMIIPFISSLSDDIINAVPQSLRDGAYAMGATRSETIIQVVLPAALPGIVGSVLLAVSRAIGETMIVVMAAGLAAKLTANPLEAVTTVTVQIVTLLVGDQEFDSPKTLAAFALGLVLFVITLILNIVALVVVRKYREKYD
jgi:phosphate transport system permease protein